MPEPFGIVFPQMVLRGKVATMYSANHQLPPQDHHHHWQGKRKVLIGVTMYSGNHQLPLQGPHHHWQGKRRSRQLAMALPVLQHPQPPHQNGSHNTTAPVLTQVWLIPYLECYACPVIVTWRSNLHTKLIISYNGKFNTFYFCRFWKWRLCWQSIPYPSVSRDDLTPRQSLRLPSELLGRWQQPLPPSPACTTSSAWLH